MNIGDTWKKIIVLANSRGVPLPTVRDPKTGIGSVSLTLVAISFGLCVLGILTKWSGKVGGIDIGTALELFYASSALYFGRNWRTSKGDNLGLPGAEQDSKKPSEPSPTVDNPN